MAAHRGALAGHLTIPLGLASFQGLFGVNWKWVLAGAMFNRRPDHHPRDLLPEILHTERREQRGQRVSRGGGLVARLWTRPSRCEDPSRSNERGRHIPISLRLVVKGGVEG